MNANHRAIKEGIRRELETARAKFHTLLADLSEQDFKDIVQENHFPVGSVSFQTGDYLYCQFSK